MPFDFVIPLRELLRVIQRRNLGPYAFDPADTASEDGYVQGVSIFE